MTYACLAGCIAASMIVPNLQAWYDCSNLSTITKAYQNVSQTGSGSSGTTTITASSSVINIVPIGSKLRIGTTDIYTVAAVSGSTIITIETLSSNYSSGTALALDKVSQINDLSGKGFNATQGTAANQPVYVPNNQNGKSIIDFIQLGAYMTIGNLNIGSAFSSVMLIELDSSIAAGDTFRRLLGMVNNNTYLFLRQSTTNLEQKAVLTDQTENRSLLSYSDYDNTYYGIAISTVDLSSRSIYLQDGDFNTATNTTASGFSTPTNAFGIGDIVDQTTIPNFRLAEMLFYSKDLSSGERAGINVYLESKWNLNVPVPDIAGLALWYDFSDNSTITSSYQTLSPTVSGTSGLSTLTASGDLSVAVFAHMTIKVNSTDIYTVSSISTTLGISTITVVGILTATYTTAALAVLKVSQVNDKSSNAYNATQNTAANQPIYVPNRQNSLSVMDFTGASFLTINSGALNIANGSNTLFVVSAGLSSSDSTREDIITIGTSSSTNWRMSYLTPSTSTIDYQSRNAAGSSVAQNTFTVANFNLFTAYRSGTTQSISVNSATATTNANGADFSSATTAFVGVSVTGTALQLIGQVAEIIVYSRALSATEIARINAYLKSKWSTP